MAQSAHAYVRGNTLLFYQWLEKQSAKSIPAGPPIWICGDCHVGNIGPLADSEGKIEIQIRDLDQTVVGNPAHDLVRLALSVATAARGSDLAGITVVKIMEQMIEGYERALTTPRTAIKAAGDELAPIRTVLEQSRRRRWHHLAEERIKDVKPEIPLGKRFWILNEKEHAGIKELFKDEAVIAKISEFKGREPGTKISVVDAAYWMKGCSSLGRLRYAVLLGIGKKVDRSYCLIDLKEATRAAAPQTGKTVQNDAERVVTGASNLSPKPRTAHVGRQTGRQGSGHARAYAARSQIRFGSAHPGASRSCSTLSRRSSRKGAWSANGPKNKILMAGEAEEAALQESRCSQLVVVKRCLADRRSRSGLPRTL
jgi:uncharacterized protein (DUF2252 family)